MSALKEWATTCAAGAKLAHERQRVRGTFGAAALSPSPSTRQRTGAGRIERLTGRAETPRGQYEVTICLVGPRGCECRVAAHHVQPRVPRGQAHHRRRQHLASLGIALGTLKVARPSSGYGGRDREGDAAARTGLQWAADGVLGLFQQGEGSFWMLRRGDPRAVDPIEQVKPNIRESGDAKRLFK
jgi:hypothetical protein